MTTLNSNEPKEMPFPSDLEGRLNAVLNSVNSELKGATLIHLDEGYSLGADITARIRRSVPGIKLPRVENFDSYCKHSLFPIGLVARENFVMSGGNSERVGYGLTEAGKKYGQPIAVFSLIYAVDNNYSLFNLLGSTHTDGSTRSPLNKVKILKFLRKQSGKDISVQNIADGIGLTPVLVWDAVIKLQSGGFLDYDSVGEDRTLRYDFVSNKSGEVKPVNCLMTLTQQVYGSIKRRGFGDAQVVSKEIDYPHSSVVSRVLIGLAEQGFVKRVGRWTRRQWNTGSIFSEVGISEKGLKFIDNFIVPVENALSSDEGLADLNEISDICMGDRELRREYLTQGINLYRSVSPGMNAVSRAETNSKIITYLSKNPGQRLKELCTHTGIEKSTLCHHLNRLVKSGELRRDGKHPVIRYLVS
ncbi:MAG: ArsR family transcriptional regulator [Nanoarchaeota archaeon]